MGLSGGVNRTQDCVCLMRVHFTATFYRGLASPHLVAVVSSVCMVNGQMLYGSSSKIQKDGHA